MRRAEAMESIPRPPTGGLFSSVLLIHTAPIRLRRFAARILARRSV